LKESYGISETYLEFEEEEGLRLRANFYNHSCSTFFSNVLLNECKLKVKTA